MERKLNVLAAIVLIMAAAALTSCGNKSDSDLEKDVSPGVVLVQNMSYYEVTFSDGTSMFFSGFDKDGDIDVETITTDEDSVKAQASYGTGFFVSSTGEIATNAHVVSNKVDDKTTNKSLNKIIQAIKMYYESQFNELTSKYQEAQAAYDYANVSPDVSYEDFYKIKLLKESIDEKRTECAQIYNAIDDIRVSDSEIKYHNDVSIAYNDTYVTKSTDFAPCVVRKTDAEHDLAIIQLKDKQTPSGKYVFNVPENDPLDAYSLTDKLNKQLSKDKNSELYMVSFNLGPALALTKDGIKSQFNHGSISQRTDDRLMYSIPTLPGSSGSPVMNKREELVAINYAGLNGTQNFNYGIRVKYLRKLLDNL